ncbi:copper resistance CopC family protein, partial [Methylomagnum sp.]
LDDRVIFSGAVEDGRQALFIAFPFCIDALMQVADINLEFFHVRFLLACLMVSPNALAHAILVKATPEREAVVAAAPEEVLLVFNDAVGEEFLALAVIDATGKRVDKHDAHLDFSARSHLRASVEKLPPGRYIVRYRVLSADGHVVSGKYAFQLQPQ